VLLTGQSSLRTGHVAKLVRETLAALAGMADPIWTGQSRLSEAILKRGQPPDDEAQSLPAVAHGEPDARSIACRDPGLSDQ
jgi:hypothetical protein